MTVTYEVIAFMTCRDESWLMEHTLPSALPSMRGASQPSDDGQLLRSALAFNTELCTLTGAAAVLFAGPLGEWMGVDTMVLRLVGLALLAYAPALLWLRSRDPQHPWHGWVPAILDEAWVIGAIVVAALGFDLSTGGRWLLLATAVPVGMSAVLQAVGAKRL